MSNTQSKDNLYNYLINHEVFNTHTHHLPDCFFDDFNLTKILEQGYVNWHKYSLTNDTHSRANFLKKVRYNSYFVWLEKSLKNIYKFDYNITVEIWDEINNSIVSKYKNNKNYHLEILKKNCKYNSIILDAYWNPGSDNDHKDVFQLHI